MRKDYNNVKVAIIDTGIQKNKEIANKIIKKISFNHTIEKTISEHGLICAEIIQTVCPQVKFWDLQILQEDGTTNISVLLEALEWCISHKVKLINLSLGTIDYFDKGKLKKTVSRLSDQGTIIVAAYHNANIKSYPAIFRGVFGVRQDDEGILENYQFMFQKQKDIEIENTLIAHWWDKDKKIHSNSYAAPVITGYIARLLRENPKADFAEALKFLQIYAVKNINCKQRIKNVLKMNGNIESLVICGMECPEGTIKSLKKFFDAEGYHTLLLQEDMIDIEAIPIQEYRKRGVSWSQTLYTAYRIYRSDIMFLDIQLERKDIVECKEIDVYIKYIDKEFQILMENIKMKVKTISEIFDLIFHQFQDKNAYEKN